MENMLLVMVITIPILYTFQGSMCEKNMEKNYPFIAVI